MDAGGPTVTKTLGGVGFVDGAVAYWDSAPLPTQFVDSTKLKATISSSLTALSGFHQLTVRNPNGPVTGSIEMMVAPVLLTIGPSLPTGGQSAIITATGIGFVPGDHVQIQTVEVPRGLQTTYVNSSRLTAVVTSDLLAHSAHALVRIMSSDVPHVVLSNQALPLTIGTPPIITSLAPAAAVRDGPTFTLTVNGTGFVQGAVVYWNGVPLPTAFAGASQLRATVDRSFTVAELHSSVYAPVNVANPDGSTSNFVQYYIQSVVPVISSVDPASVFAGGPAITLTITGSGFYSGVSTAWFADATQLKTTYISPTQLTAILPADQRVRAWRAYIKVRNSNSFMDFGTPSQAFGFEIRPPELTSTTPSSVRAASPSFTLTATGAGFFPGHSISWNGELLATQYVSPTQLTAAVDAGKVATAGSVTIAVVTAGREASSGLQFQISPIAPAVSTVKPSSIAAGSPAFTLTVGGSNFIPGSAVLWNGTALPTSFVSPTQLSATVAASLLLKTGAAAIAVTTSGGLSSPVAFSITAPAPALDTGSVGNAFSGDPKISPGCLVTIYGSNLADRTSAAASFPLPTRLGGTSVTINDTAAPLLFSSATQINLQAPFELAPGAATLVVDVNGVRSAPIPVTVAATSPGALRAPQSNHAVALNYSNGTLNAPDNPAAPGDYIIVYMTGQGRVDSSIGVGEPAPVTPLILPLAPVTATVGGRPAEVGFAGLAPGYAGLLQVNLKLPNVEQGEQILNISIGDASSNPTVVSVGAAAQAPAAPTP
jgi:uncharacterized protein (TIGR03437 family)